MRLAGKVILVTGAASGMGRVATRMFVEQGAKVIAADINGDALTEAVAEVEDRDSVLPVVGNVAVDADVLRMVAEGIQRFGSLNVLYNNAGGSTVRDSRVTDTPFEEFWSKMKLDLFGTWLGCRYGIQAMMDAGHGGSVINSTSIFALIGTHGKDAYTAAKGAVSALTRSMAVEYARHRIRVNAVAPGPVLWPDDESFDELSRQRIISHTPLRREGTPDDIAVAVYFLLAQAHYVTGVTLDVDGGRNVAI